jgi:HSP20 family protein
VGAKYGNRSGPAGFGGYLVPVAGRDFDKLHDEIEELFADLWQVPRFSGTRRGFRPNVDSYHTLDPHELTVVVELPGVDPASVQVVAGERVLLIAGERARPKVAGHVYHQMEIEYGPFQRQVRLPEDVDPDAARAHFENGVLTVSLPVSTKAATHDHIVIKVDLGL